VGAACRGGGRTKPNGNCTNLGPDGLVVQCVGRWAEDKHDHVRRLIEASRGARMKYLKTNGRRPAGGAAYIEIFAGPGMARINTSGEIIDGSPLIAAKHTEVPFTELIFVDKEQENVDALVSRLNAIGRPAQTFCGDCNEIIRDVVRHVPPYGLNLAFVDPFSAGQLSFDTLRVLAQVTRMDLILLFPTGMDIKRNFDRSAETITRFLGTDEWQDRAAGAREAVKLIGVLREQLKPYGYTQGTVRSVPIMSGGRVLYHLVFATKEALADRLWNSIARTTSKGQRSLPGIE
jgi:three-Cys-motif partner protein